MSRRPYLFILLSLFFLCLSGCKDEAPPKVEKPKENAVAQQQAAEKEQNATDEVKVKAKEKTIQYRNEEHGFTLRLPATWEGKYVVEQSTSDSDGGATYVFKYKQENIELFSIVVLNISKEEWNREYSGGLLEYLGEKEGKIFAYGIPSELPTQLSQDKKEKIHSLIDVTQMVNQDVPRIVRTFKLLY